MSLISRIRLASSPFLSDNEMALIFSFSPRSIDVFLSDKAPISSLSISLLSNPFDIEVSSALGWATNSNQSEITFSPCKSVALILNLWLINWVILSGIENVSLTL